MWLAIKFLIVMGSLSGTVQAEGPYWFHLQVWQTTSVLISTPTGKAIVERFMTTDASIRINWPQDSPRCRQLPGDPPWYTLEHMRANQCYPASSGYYWDDSVRLGYEWSFVLTPEERALMLGHEMWHAVQAHRCGTPGRVEPWGAWVHSETARLDHALAPELGLERDPTPFLSEERSGC